jgi:hypothetical protein
MFLGVIHFFNKKIRLFDGQIFLAGAVGIEPTQTVLETAVLPLYDAPKIDIRY